MLSSGKNLTCLYINISNYDFPGQKFLKLNIESQRHKGNMLTVATQKERQQVSRQIGEVKGKVNMETST